MTSDMLGRPELEELAMKDERLIEAFTAWEELSQTPDTIIAYQSRLKTIIDEEAKLDYAEFDSMHRVHKQFTTIHKNA